MTMEPKMEPAHQEAARPGLRLAKPALAVGVAVVAVLGAALIFGGGDKPVGGIAGGGGPPAATDAGGLSDGGAARLADWNRDGPVSLPLVTVQEIPEAIAALELPAADEKLFRAHLTAGQVRLVWLVLWDDLAEDGDIVEVRSSGYRVQVRLANLPRRLAVPLGPDNRIDLVGVFDGGGGITAGIDTLSGVRLTPVMAPGQTLTLPVR